MKTKVMQLRIHLARTVKRVASEGVVAKAELNRFTNTWPLLCELNMYITTSIEISEREKMPSQMDPAL